jgi:UDP-N-acetylglucosamine 4,6-dehydratase
MSKLLITGGTGSFGKTLIDKYLDTNTFDEIRVFSRDEKKQHDLRNLYSSNKIKFYIGDVRDQQSLEAAVENVNCIFHAAALKQVPSCEFFPMEAIKTNILGTDNLLQLAKKHRVGKTIVLSTDKSAYPTNVMGMTKGLAEKVMISSSRNLEKHSSTFCATRYGNVMGSRGSVIPLFINQIKNNEDLTITDPNMSRFMMTLDNAVDLVLYAFEKGKNGDIFVQKSPAVTIGLLAKALITIFESKSKLKIIGTRHGEKMHETLITKEEIKNSEDLGNYYRINADNRDLNYNKYYTIGNSNNKINEYNSNNTDQLNLEDTIKLLVDLQEVKRALN